MFDEEKKATVNAKVRRSLIGGIQKFSTEDGPGIRTTVFFKGCPIKCKWCHNPDLISYHREILYSPSKCIGCGGCVKACKNDAIKMLEDRIKIDRELCKYCGKCAESCYTDALRISGCLIKTAEIMKAVIEDKSFYVQTGGGVTLSGGEVTSHIELALAIEQECVKKGIGVAIDTCGYTCYENLKKLAENAEYILYDIKCIDSAKHEELTGVGNELILENLKMLGADARLHNKVIIRMPLVHPVNDTIEYMQRTCDFLNEIGLHEVNGIPYHNMGSSKSRGMGLEPIEFETPSDEYLNEIKALFERNNISFTIMGRDD